MPKITKDGEKLIIGLTPEEYQKKLDEEKSKYELEKPLLALRELQEYLITKGLKPKHKL